MLDLQQDDAQGYLDGLLLSALPVDGRATVRRVQDGAHSARLSARAVAADPRLNQMVGRGSAARPVCPAGGHSPCPAR
jgi:hypothetical protein